MKKDSGSAAILIILVLGLVSVLIGISLTKTGYGASLMGRNTAASSDAFYAANSGVEDAFYKVKNVVGYGVSSPETYELTIGEGTAKVTVSGTESKRTIKSVGKSGRYVRRIEAEIQDTTLRPGFEYAIHSGVGGVELRNTTVVTGRDDSDGNVFSNSYIKGAKSDHNPDGTCKNAASAVEGFVWAVTDIDKIAPNDSGVCVTKDAHAENFKYCYINGIPYGPNTPSADCTSGQPWQNEPVPDPVPLPDMGVDDIKDHLIRDGDYWSGDCIADASGGPQDCTEGTGIIGNLIIDGDLIKPSNENINVSGPIWVKRGINFESNGIVGLTPDITEVSQIVVADEPIIIDSNVTFGSNGTAFLFFIATYVPGSGEICDDPSISLSSNTESVLFYANQGCITVTANSSFHGAILGEKILVDNNSQVEYDPALAEALFGITKEGGWQTLSFKEL